MLRFTKRIVVAVLLLIVGVYFIRHLDFLDPDGFTSNKPEVADFMGPAKSQQAVTNEFTEKTGRRFSKVSWVEEGEYLPLNVSYQLLAGKPSTQKKYLTVGISSVKRIKGYYLYATLQSLFSHSSPEERSSMVVVVLLADFDNNWRVTTVKEIKTAFASELEQGQLLVIHVSKQWYPTLTGLKRNYDDPAERVTFRSKQNIDYSFLIHYCAGIGQYYLQLEDDISCANNFLTQIKTYIDKQEAMKINWVMLEFSVLGYIGKLYKSAHTPLLARFLFLFYQEMPCDWLMSHFRELLTQKEIFVFKPSLFQHMGTFSSFQGGYNSLKDRYFVEGLNGNPPADVFSDMLTYQEQSPRLAWEDGQGFFWGFAPVEGNHLTVVFKAPTVLTSILVETGADGKDFLESGQVEIGQEVISTSNNEKTCKDFQAVGSFKNGGFQIKDLDKKYSSATSCLRLLVTEKQNSWLIIQNIRVSTHPKKDSQTKNK